MSPRTTVIAQLRDDTVKDKSGPCTEALALLLEQPPAREYSDYDMRIAALDKANGCASNVSANLSGYAHDTADEVVKRAEAYYQFLKGFKVAPTEGAS